MKQNQSGVTIVELLVSVAVAAMISTVMLVISLNFFGSTIRSQVTAEMAADSHYMLRAIIEDIRVADSVAATNTLPDANQPSGGWLTNDASNVLVLSLPAIDSNRDIIYNEETNDPYMNEVVYFIDGTSTFYKRLLKNDTAVDNTLITTCPAEPGTPGCPSDRKYSAYVQDMTFTFYDTSNTVTTDPTQARSLRVGIVLERKVFGTPVKFNNSIFTKLRN